MSYKIWYFTEYAVSCDDKVNATKEIIVYWD